MGSLARVVNSLTVMEFTDRDQVYIREIFQGFEKQDDLPDINRTIMKILLLSSIIVFICLIFMIFLISIYKKGSNKIVEERLEETGRKLEGNGRRKLEVVTFVLSKPTVIVMEEVELDNKLLS